MITQQDDMACPVFEDQQECDTPWLLEGDEENTEFELPANLLLSGLHFMLIVS